MSIRIQFRAIRPARRKPLEYPLRSKLDRVTKQIAQEVLEVVRRYPPVPAGSDYVRTFELYGNWRLVPHSTKDTVDWLVSNSTRYASLVHGPGYNQWPFHRAHMWRNIEDVVNGFNRNGRFQIAAQRAITDLVVDAYAE